MKKLASIFAVLAVAASPVLADSGSHIEAETVKHALRAVAISPAQLAADRRIQTETYDNTRVYQIVCKVGRVALVQLEEDEALTISPSSVLGMGDAAAWTLSARGNNISFKPSQPSPNTNMIVVTNKRTYAFDLSMASKGDTPTYILRFDYPDTAAAKAAKELKEAAQTAAARAESVAINTKYFWRGNNEMLKPTAAWDDGRFTRLEYDHAGELPVFYKILPDGTEALLNYNVEPKDRKTIVLHEVIRVVEARFGKDVIEIVNSNYKLPKLNKNGAGIYGAVRNEIGEVNEQ